MSEFKLTAPPLKRRASPKKPSQPAENPQSPVSNQDSQSDTPSITGEAREVCLALLSDAINEANQWFTEQWCYRTKEKKDAIRLHGMLTPLALLYQGDWNAIALLAEWRNIEYAVECAILCRSVEQVKTQLKIYLDTYKRICGEYWTVIEREGE